MTLAPIALFVYNRRSHLEKTVSSLLDNRLASSSDLFVFSDAAKDPSLENNIREVRSFLRTIKGFRSITIIERENNLGLANSIISGVSHILEKFDRIIVLEDDMILDPAFLDYMNQGLTLYKNEDRVVSIHGYIYPVKGLLPETFFLRGADCWGWGTWRRGWRIFEPDGKKLLIGLHKENLEREFNFDGSFPYINMLKEQIEGKNDSWAIRWYASAFLKNKFTLYPGHSLVENIGLDGSGKHCGITNSYSVTFARKPIRLEKISIEENISARNKVVHFFKSLQPSLYYRIKMKIRNLFHFF